MNPEFVNFLQSVGGTVSSNGIEFSSNSGLSDRQIYPIAHLSAIAVSGADARSFLQGQLTCNMLAVNGEQASFSAACNAKGRVISTMLVLQSGDLFYLLLPQALTAKLIATLRSYILRAKVKLECHDDSISLIGFRYDLKTLDGLFLPSSPLAATDGDVKLVKLPTPSSNRYLFVGSSDQACQFWAQAVERGRMAAGNSEDWTLADLSSGIPWFGLAATEKYIPQALNLESLGGISFDKGCYTGQEIVARTHYLGTAKRRLLLGECGTGAVIDEDMAVTDNLNQTIGHVLTYQHTPLTSRLLFVAAASDETAPPFLLKNSKQDKIEIIPFE